VLSLEPSNLTATHRRGRVLQKFGMDCPRRRGAAVSDRASGRHEEARDAYERTLQLTPKDSRDWNATAQSLQSLSRHEEALAAFQRVRLFRQHDVVVSLLTLVQALELQPNYADCCKLLAVTARFL
jgi:tetratricopeptide (TPR) repeat protein